MRPVLLATALLLPTAASAAPVFSQLVKVSYPTYGYTFGGAALTPGGNVVMVAALGVPSLSGQIVVANKPATAGAAWTPSKPISFPTQGIGLPNGALAADAAGNLYGATAGGGITTSPCASVAGTPGCGAIFRLAPSGAGYTLTILSKFSGGQDGAGPSGNLTLDAAGNLYGATAFGGGGTACSNGCGTIFKLTPTGTGTYTRTTLYSFKGGTDGTGPGGYMAIDGAGSLYGTTLGGGLPNCGNLPNYTPDGRCGTVFKLTAAGRKTILYTFADGADGSLPAPGVGRDTKGGLYVAAASGGNTSADCANRIQLSGCGVVFKLTPPATAGNPWTRTNIWVPTGTDGATPGTPLLDRRGNLFVTASHSLGGASACSIYYCGTVVKLTKPTTTNPSWTRKVLYTFKNNGTDLAGPLYRPVGDAAGSIYAVTQYGNDSGIFTITGAGYLP